MKVGNLPLITTIFFINGAFNTCLANEKIDSDIVGVAIDAGTGNINKNNFFGNFDLNYENMGWEINKDNDNPVLSYETEGLNVTRFSGNIGYKKDVFFHFNYEFMLGNTDNQKDIIKSNVDQESGLEVFTGSIKLDPVVKMAFGDSWGKRLLSFRYKYTNRVYLGKATSIKNGYLISDSTSFDYINKKISNAENIAVGSQFSFRTSFIENEFTLPVAKFDFPISFATPWHHEVKLVPHDLRIGYFSSNWEKPSDTMAITIDSRGVVYDAEYKTSGAVISIETVDSGAPGINADISFRWGINNTLSTPIDFEKVTGQEIEYEYALINIALWYNLYLTENWFFTLEYSQTKQAMNVEVLNETEQEVSSKRLIHDTDDFRRIFLGASYRF